MIDPSEQFYLAAQDLYDIGEYIKVFDNQSVIE